ncbi:MAG: hypothetical protein AB1758_08510, partial [Candidatus Eremiobacterota bacterium]
ATTVDYTSPPARLPGAAPAAAQAPVITALDYMPQVNPQTLPAGCDATVPLDGHLTFSISATDADGDSLFCRWTADGGAFSSSSEDRMVWEPTADTWQAEWQWRPPGTAVEGQRFSLTYEVYDSRGQVAAPFGAAILTVETLPRARLIFTRQNPPGGPGDIWIVNSDGTGLRNLTNSPARDDLLSTVSQDGTKIFYFLGSSGNIFQMNVDGTGVQALAGGGNYTPIVSPRGNLVAFSWRAVGADYQLWGMLPDGSNRRFIADMTYTGGLSYYKSSLCSFSPDGSRLVYPKNNANFDLYTVNIDSTGRTPLVATPGCDQKPLWAPDGWIWFVTDQDGNQEIYKVREDGTGLTRVTNSPQDDTAISVSPDLQKIAVSANGDLVLFNADGTNPVQVTSGPELDLRATWLP